ncbi:Plasmodium vivax Vir protein, putative [Plasmodium vivax]|uniref:Vir protein, putative n=1 Tax=Plasmodium vivax TaxID=5855 RepID=A0A1G4EIJ2_PLAVI|nr:Plasmodium vivax Vir protein, putative [Plasmodium vivax]
MSYTTKYNFVSSCEELRNEIQGYSQDESHLYDEWCNDIKSQYEKYIDLNNKYTCQRVMYILNSISTESTSVYNDDPCKYLYYWIYKDLLQKNANNDMALEMYRSILRIYIENYDVDDKHICKNYIYEDKDMILKKSAKLTKLYDTFNNNSIKCDCACAKNCSELYNMFVEECHKDYDYDFCGELENFKQLYDKNMINIGKCQAPNILPSALKNELHLIIIIPMIILTILSFLVFALYKFTPIGSRITNRKRRKNVFFENQFDRTHILSPTSGRTSRTEQNIAYNIAYDSTKYS